MLTLLHVLMSVTIWSDLEILTGKSTTVYNSEISVSDTKEVRSVHELNSDTN